MLMLFVAAVPAAAQRTPREELEKAHEGVRFHEVGERVRIAYGVPMTVGETPEEAAANWLTLYGEIFIDSREPGGPDLRQTRHFATQTGKVTFGYRQWIDGVPVERSSARVVVMELDEQWRVVYASTLVGLRPVGGLPEPKVTAKAALEAAQEHDAGKGLTAWGEPELVAIYSDPPSGTGEAQTIYKIAGWGNGDSLTFHVDAMTGSVVDYFSNVMHGWGGEITGTVTGKASPGTKPDRDDKECENLPAAVPMPLTRVVALNSSQQVVSSTFTDENGDYILEVANDLDVTVLTFLEGEAWFILNLNGGFPNNHPNCPTPGTPVTASSSATSPQSDVDLVLNSTPSQYGTAQVNTARHLWQTRQYVRERVDDEILPLPGLDDVVGVWVNADGLTSCNAKYERGGFGCNGGDPLLVFTISQSSIGTPCINSGYSTWVSHEYGHFLLEKMLDIENDTALTSFHEGWSDVLAFLTQDTEIFGEQWTGCNGHVRRPLVTDPTYPVCDDSPHARGELLGAIWLDLRNSSLGLQATRQLHVDWMFLCEWPNDEACFVSRQQSAGIATLIQVLTADDDDGNLTNGTPNDAVICEVFATRGIESEMCEESLRGRCYADCDQSTGAGVLDVFDYLCFGNRFASGASYACDCDTTTGVGVCDMLDLLCFQEAYVRGCE